MKYAPKAELYLSQLAEVGLLRSPSRRYVREAMGLKAPGRIRSGQRPLASATSVTGTPLEASLERPGSPDGRIGQVYKWWRRQRAVVVVAFAALFIVQLYASMNKLLYNSTISTVKWKPFEDGFPLPAVTVCSGSNMTTNLTLADFVRDCEVIGTPCEEALGDFLEVTTVTLSERRCFTFKSNRNAPLNQKNNGIDVEVKFQPNDIIKDKIEVYLHGRTQAYNPFYVLGLDRNIELPLGKTIKVELMVEMSRYLNGYGQACREEADYSFVDCVRFCLEQHLIESGPQCRLEWMLPRDSAPLCTDEEVARNLSMLASDKESTMAREFPECEAQCEPACLLYTYRGVEYSSLVKPKLKKKHRAEFKFKFRDTCYTAIEEVVNYDFWSMIGEVGGTLGFLLGLSLLSILDLIADGVRTLNSWRIRRKRRHACQLVLRAKY